MASLAQIFDLLSYKRSAASLYRRQVLYLKTMYLGSDSGEAELRLTRDDYAIVPEAHILRHIEDLEKEIAEIEEEIRELESYPVDNEEKKNAARGKDSGKSATKSAQSG